MFELLTPAEMARADNITIKSGIDGFELMLAAGQAVAHTARNMFPENGPIAILCGPGNNGGDGYVAAQLLRETGRKVTCYTHGVPRSGTDAMRASVFYKGEVKTIADFKPSDFVGVIDALFGAGLKRPITGQPATIIEELNSSNIPVIAVDLPSGISGETGQVMGCAVKARATVTFFRKKPGHILQPGRGFCGVLHLADIGIDDAVLYEIQPQAFENASELWVRDLPSVSTQSHKYSRGHAAIFSGPLYSTGAARLAAIAAGRSGAGAVTLLSPPDALAVNASHLTSIMLRETRSLQDAMRFITERKVSAVALGPGYGNAVLGRDHALGVLSMNINGLVLDADGITAFEKHPTKLFESPRGKDMALVLTPHEGEFARLFPDIHARQDLSKLTKAREAAKRANAILVFKGPDTVIAAPDGRAAINSNATPLLATAGSGDVLTGIICGLLAQNMPAFKASCAAVWMHADAARRFGRGLIAEDLPALLPQVWSSLVRAG